MNESILLNFKITNTKNTKSTINRQSIIHAHLRPPSATFGRSVSAPINGHTSTNQTTRERESALSNQSPRTHTVTHSHHRPTRPIDILFQCNCGAYCVYENTIVCGDFDRRRFANWTQRPNSNAPTLPSLTHSLTHCHSLPPVRRSVTDCHRILLSLCLLGCLAASLRRCVAVSKFEVGRLSCASVLRFFGFVALAVAACRSAPTPPKPFAVRRSPALPSARCPLPAAPTVSPFRLFPQRPRLLASRPTGGSKKHGCVLPQVRSMRLGWVVVLAETLSSSV